jgi:hypothetical protein
MLALVLTNWNLIRLVEQDVSGHQHWVGKDAYANTLIPNFLRLILKLRHATGFTESSQTLHHPTQLIMCNDMGLNKEGAMLRIYAQG